MKMFLALFFAGVLLAARARADIATNGTTSAPKDKPVVGMTMEKARSYYGAPFKEVVLPKGARWYYRLKFSEVYGRAWVPFYIDSENVRWGSIDFGPDGRVKSFDWQRVVLR